MSMGRILAGSIVVASVVAGGAMWWLQVYGYYDRVEIGAENPIKMTTLAGEAQTFDAKGAQGIDADSSPLRFRACFSTDLSQDALEGLYQAYPLAEPLMGPSWFDCYDARKVGKALETGEAKAFLSEKNIHPGVDRVVAVMPDGHAFVWHQLNEEVKD